MPVGGHRLLLSRGSNRSGFRLRWRDEATLQAKASGIQQIGESRLDDFPQLGACRTEPERAGDGLDQLIALRAVVPFNHLGDRDPYLFRRQDLGLAQGIGFDVTPIPHHDGLVRDEIEWASGNSAFAFRGLDRGLDRVSDAVARSHQSPRRPDPHDDLRFVNWSFDGNHANDVLHHLGHRSSVRVELPADRELRFLVMRDRGLLPIYFRGHDIDVRSSCAVNRTLILVTSAAWLPTHRSSNPWRVMGRPARPRFLASPNGTVRSFLS